MMSSLDDFVLDDDIDDLVNQVTHEPTIVEEEPEVEPEGPKIEIVDDDDDDDDEPPVVARTVRREEKTTDDELPVVARTVRREEDHLQKKKTDDFWFSKQQDDRPMSSEEAFWRDIADAKKKNTDVVKSTRLEDPTARMSKKLEPKEDPVAAWMRQHPATTRSSAPEQKKPPSRFGGGDTGWMRQNSMSRRDPVPATPVEEAKDLVAKRKAPVKKTTQGDDTAWVQKSSKSLVEQTQEAAAAAVQFTAVDEANELAATRPKAVKTDQGDTGWMSTSISREATTPAEEAKDLVAKRKLKTDVTSDAAWVQKKSSLVEQEAVAAATRITAVDEAKELVAQRKVRNDESDAGWMRQSSSSSAVKTPADEARDLVKRQAAVKTDDAAWVDDGWMRPDRRREDEMLDEVAEGLRKRPEHHHQGGRVSFAGYDTPHRGHSPTNRRRSMSIRRMSMSRAQRKSISPGDRPTSSSSSEDEEFGGGDEIPVNPAVDALLGAAEMGDVNACRILVTEHGVPADAVDPNDGYTPLLVAAEEGNVDVAEFLLDAKARVNKVDKLGRTPVYAAAVVGQPEIITFLIQRGADPTITDLDGRTPIWAACAVRQTKAATALLRASQKRGLDLDLNHRDPCGLTAFEFASKRGYNDILHFLRKNGAYDGGATTSRLNITPPTTDLPTLASVAH